MTIITNPKFPLVELHRHLDGNVRLETILDVGLKNDIDLPARTLDGLRPYVQVTEPKPSILSFFEKFKWLTLAMVDYDTCSRIAYENVEDAKKQFAKVVQLRQLIGDLYSEAADNYNFAATLLNTDKKEQALPYAQRCLELMRQINEPNLINSAENLVQACQE